MSAFFDYSLVIYGRTGVAERCLALQDREGLDVNLVLFCLWAASRGRALDDQEMKRLIDTVAAWQGDVVSTFRALRRWLKDRAVGDEELAALRENAKRSELEAEEIEQGYLEACLEMSPGDRPDPALAAANFRIYLSAAGRSLTGDTCADLVALLVAAWPDLGSEAADALLKV